MPDEPLTGHETAAAPSHPSDDPVALRAQNRALADLLVEEADALQAVREYALECGSRAGALIDAATVAARLWPILAGFDLKPRVCPVCVERRLEALRHATFINGLADLQRAEAAG